MNIDIFSQRLRDTRRKKNITQAQLARQSGVTAATISAYENTDSKKGCNPSLENAAKLAEALSVSLDWLCGFATDKKSITTVDFLKVLVNLSKTTKVAIDIVDICNEYDKRLISAAANLFTDEEYNENHLVCEANNVKDTWLLPLASFRNNYIVEFLAEWKKMKSLYEDGTIDESLYDLWLENCLLTLKIEKKQINDCIFTRR